MVMWKLQVSKGIGLIVNRSIAEGQDSCPNCGKYIVNRDRACVVFQCKANPEYKDNATLKSSLSRKLWKTRRASCSVFVPMYDE
jgi:predicted RNA-binding Zn-ribbon protein involved in translation (DUF1610 family)